MTTINTQGYSANEYHILAQAQELNQDASIVLPLLNFAINPYTVFIINKLLVRKLDLIENILAELKFVNNPEIIDMIDVVQYRTLANFLEIEEDLNSKGIKYLDTFLISKADLIDYEDYI